MSLDDIWGWLSLGRHELENGAEINAQMQCIRVIMMVSAKLGLERMRAQERERRLERMVRELPDGKQNSNR